MEHLRGAAGEALDEAAAGRWREPVAALLEGKGTPRATAAGREGAARPMTTAELIAEHGSPLWLVDLDRVRTRLREFRARLDAGLAGRRGRLLLQDQPRCRPSCSRWPTRAPRPRWCARPSTRWRATRSARAAARRDRQRPGQARALLERAAADGALVVVDSEAELARAARAGVDRVGLRVALPGIGVEPTRFGIAPGLVPDAAARARELGLEVEALSAHLVSTGFDAAARGQPPRLGAAITVQWPPAPERARRGGRAPGAPGRRASAWARSTSAAAIPAAPAVAAHAAAVAGALRAARLRRAPDPRAGPRPGRRRGRRSR